MSEQQAEQTSAEPGSLHAGPAVPPSSNAEPMPAAASAPETPEVESPRLVPEQAAATGAKADTPEPVTPKADAPAGKVMIMSSGDRAWGSPGTDAKVETEQSEGTFGTRRLSAMAAVVALAVVAGALGGALVTAGLAHLGADDAAGGANRALEAFVARIDADMLALKVSVEHTSKMGMSQFNKTSDRLDKVERAQIEPAAKLAKLSEAVDKLRAAPQAAPVPVAAVPVAAKDVTGSIAATTPAAAPKVEVGKLPTVEGWVLRDVANGVALIESRRGMYEVYAGDSIPGLGRVDAIRRQDGRWVVVTSKGLIASR